MPLDCSSPANPHRRDKIPGLCTKFGSDGSWLWRLDFLLLPCQSLSMACRGNQSLLDSWRPLRRHCRTHDEEASDSLSFCSPAIWHSSKKLLSRSIRWWSLRCIDYRLRNTPSVLLCTGPGSNPLLVFGGRATKKRNVVHRRIQSGQSSEWCEHSSAQVSRNYPGPGASQNLFSQSLQEGTAWEGDHTASG